MKNRLLKVLLLLVPILLLTACMAKEDQLVAGTPLLNMEDILAGGSPSDVVGENDVGGMSITYDEDFQIEGYVAIKMVGRDPTSIDPPIRYAPENFFQETVENSSENGSSQNTPWFISLLKVLGTIPWVLLAFIVMGAYLAWLYAYKFVVEKIKPQTELFVVQDAFTKINTPGVVGPQSMSLKAISGRFMWRRSLDPDDLEISTKMGITEVVQTLRSQVETYIALLAAKTDLSKINTDLREWTAEAFDPQSPNKFVPTINTGAIITAIQVEGITLSPEHEKLLMQAAAGTQAGNEVAAFARAAGIPNTTVAAIVKALLNLGENGFVKFNNPNSGLSITPPIEEAPNEQSI